MQHTLDVCRVGSVLPPSLEKPLKMHQVREPRRTLPEQMPHRRNIDYCQRRSHDLPPPTLRKQIAIVSMSGVWLQHDELSLPQQLLSFRPACTYAATIAWHARVVLGLRNASLLADVNNRRIIPPPLSLCLSPPIASSRSPASQRSDTLLN